MKSERLNPWEKECFHQRDSPYRASPYRDVDIEIDDMEPLEGSKLTVRNNFYAGTFHGWIAARQTQIVTILFIIAIIILGTVLASAYVSSGSDDTASDDCWPLNCQSSYMTSTYTLNTIFDDYYWATQSPTTKHHPFDFTIPNPTNRRLNSIVFIDGSELIPYQFAAVGAESTLLTTSDNMSWALRPLTNQSLNVMSIQYAMGSLWIEEANGDMYRSIDGTDWLPSNHSFESGVVTDGTHYVGIEHNRAYFQHNEIGDDWNQLSIPYAVTLDAIAFGNDMYMIAGTAADDSVTDRYACVWTSENGFIWTPHRSSTGNIHNHKISLTFAKHSGNDRGFFLLFADNLYLSSNGESWLLVAQSPWKHYSAPEALSCIANGVCCALTGSESGVVISSSFDYGQTWTSQMYSDSLLALTSNQDDRFVAVGEQGRVYEGTVVGMQIIWELASPDVEYSVTSLSFGGTLFYASTEDDVGLLTSSDGLTWSGAESPPLRFVSYGRGDIVGISVLGDVVSLYYSSDAVTWRFLSSEVIETDVEPINLVYDGHQFLVLCKTKHGDAIIYLSVYGNQWSELETDIVDDYLVTIVWNSNSNSYYAIGHSGTVFKSNDLLTWTKETIGLSYTCLDLAVSQTKDIVALSCVSSVSTAPQLLFNTGSSRKWILFESCVCEFCDPMNQVTFDETSGNFYFVGNQVLRTDGKDSLEYFQPHIVHLNSSQNAIVANDILTILSNGAIVSGSVATLTFESVC